jgi:ring-1,2-phenylacetyl-CoA epoxidase subunit PaaE
MKVDFAPLTVERVDKLTDDAAAVTFRVPPELADTFAFRAGQTLTLRRGELRRSYSICALEGTAPRIGVREVVGGQVSGWLVHQLNAGDVVEVQAPSGTFTPNLADAGHHVLIAAGSGVTPMLSIASSVLAAEATSTVTLLYGNRRSSTVMFADEVAELKDVYPARFQLVHVLSREPQEVELFNGRLDRRRLAELLPATVDVPAVDHWWLCGPFGMVTDAAALLADLGVPADRVHRELFWVGDEPPVLATHDEAAVTDGAHVTVVLDGRSASFTLPRGTSILDGAQAWRPDLPFACKGGVCGTCRAKLTNGEVSMRRNFALEPDEVERGYVLTCQSHPLSDDVTVDFDA